MKNTFIDNKTEFWKKFNLSSIIESKCTSKSFGNVPIKQLGFYCQFCDKKKNYKLYQLS